MMFEVVRWPGPGNDGEKRSEGALTLHQLNARARERAEARRRGTAANGNDNAHPPASVKTRLGIDSHVDAVAEAEDGRKESKKERKRKKKEKAGAAVEVIEETELVIQTANKKEERRKMKESETVILIPDKKEKKRKIVEMEPVIQILDNKETEGEVKEKETVIQNLDKKEKKRKKSKLSLPSQADEDVIGEAHVEVAVEAVKRQPAGDEVSPPEKKKKKKKERKNGFTESEAQVDRLEDVGKRVSNLEVSGSLLPASLNAAISLDSKFQDVSEKPDVIAAVQAGKEEKKTKRKRMRSDTEEPDVDSAAQTVRRESKQKTQIVRSDMGEPDVVAAVQIVKVKKKKKRGNAVRDETETTDVAVTDENIKEKRKNQSKRVSDDDEAPDKEAESVDTFPLDSRVESTSGKMDKVPADEVDLSKIERDVEKILGHDLLPSKSAAGITGKGPAVLPWMREPMEISSHKSVPLNQVPLLDVRLQDALRNTGIEALFPVQVAVWHETVGPGFCDRDLCVSSPTGSGKTLSYALPIVQKLSTRVICRLRALIVLPTRDLASQVKAVFDTIAPAVGLRVGLAIGQTSIVAEAAQLVQFRRQMAHSFGGSDTLDQETAESCIDILVATPGRLMDHLRNTKEFTLEHLLYLVVDETDRLLRQSYQEWLPNVLSAVAAIETRKSPLITIGSVLKGCLPSVHTIRHQGMERGLRGRTFPRMMKMVLSATLTRDPSKIAKLALHCPMYIAQNAVENRYHLPEQLQAFKLVCKAGEKPLYLVALLQQLAEQQTIVFTASVVATHRLFTLLGFFEGLSFKVVEYSSLQHQQARSKALAKFREGAVQVLVASDAMTRGMDVEGVGNVVNYDMPVYAKTYVHRVGRTARAGRAGSSYTLLRREEVRHFKSLLKKADNSSCKDYKLPALATENLYEQYLQALEKLKQLTKEESGSGQAAAPRRGPVQASDGEQGGSGADELFL